MSENQHPIEGLMGTTMTKIREMVDVNTIIGDPVTAPDGTIIIPVSKVGFGFVAGGSDFPSKSQPTRDFFGGGSGAGISIQPLAFLVISNGDVKILQMDNSRDSTDRLVTMVPDVIQKISDLFPKSDATQKGKNQKKPVTAEQV